MTTNYVSDGDLLTPTNVNSWLQAASGAQEDVVSHGAVGDGVTDDTAAIQAAIDALNHSQGNAGAGIQGVGGIVYFPPGIYSITAPLTITAASDQQNIALVGAGPLASVIRNDATAGENAITVTGVSGNSVHNFLVRDLGVSGNASSGVGIYCTRTIRQVEFDRVDFYNHGDHGLEFNTTCNMIVVKSCRFRDNTNAGLRTSVNGEQIWMYGNSFRDNNIGVSIGSFINICNIYGGDIHGNSSYGVSILGADADDGMVTSIELRGIYFEDNNQDILVDNQGATYYAANVLIAANSFSQTTPASSGSHAVEIRRGQYIALEHNEFRKITSANVDACIRVGSEAQDVYLGPNWFPSSTTVTNVSIDASATRVWGYTVPDTDAQRFTPWGHSLVHVRTDANRGAAGTAGRVIFNTDDGQLNIDDGTNWTLPDGTTT